MISIERQQGLLLAISKRLKKPINTYAIGGTAMMFFGFKDATLDIDLVFENKEDRETFKDAIISLGYKPMDSTIVYGAKINRPQMFTLGDERFDLFLNEVVDFIFSKEMQARATHTHKFEGNLIIKVADPNDIILMKCATDRLKDLEDAKNIISEFNVNWELIFKEAQNQKKLGKIRAVFEFGYFLEKLENRFKIIIPKKIKDDVWECIKKDAEANKKGKSKRKNQ
ncbi:MAG: hypothetical protein ACP5OG_06035 [Candidatus Nanoarchaeia archaeon]